MKRHTHESLNDNFDFYLAHEVDNMLSAEQIEIDKLIVHNHRLANALEWVVNNEEILNTTAKIIENALNNEGVGK